MKAFRIVRHKFAQLLTGEGAKLYGGRWNSIGTPCIYSSTNISLCLCEYLVNLPSYLLPKDLQLVTYDFNESDVQKINVKDLPKGWDAIPVSTVSQYFGDELLTSGESLAFLIPSVIIQQENNIVINTRYPDIDKWLQIESVEEFKLDNRFEK